ncbi:MAG: hypothetical protein MJ138_03850 [Kiritimatiellae bacterium]|nr:hypothetical protein [Kiritimatiellia bacterium]
MRDAWQIPVFLALTALLAASYPVRAVWAPPEKAGAAEPFATCATVDASTWAELLNAVRPSWRSRGDVRLSAGGMDAGVPGLAAPPPPHEPLPFSAAPPPAPAFAGFWKPASQRPLAPATLAAPPAAVLAPVGALAPSAATGPAHARAEMLSLDDFESLKRKGNEP